jgi:hypothetical protein
MLKNVDLRISVYQDIWAPSDVFGSRDGSEPALRRHNRLWRPLWVNRVIQQARLGHMERVLARREWLAGSFSVADILMADVLRLVAQFDGLAGCPVVVIMSHARQPARPSWRHTYAHFAAAEWAHTPPASRRVTLRSPDIPSRPVIAFRRRLRQLRVKSTGKTDGSLLLV